ncbi:MAG: molybdenum cofactor biosynthesis protein [Lachnospiraceae bacterium]|nr:molybdenum cofactor biosynthesis protein [Lachnospiraceae bacterium]
MSLLSYGSVKEFEERLRQAALCCPNEPENLDRDQNPESGYLKDIFENKEILENKEIPVIAAGSFGENLLVEGLDLKDIACGTILQAGDVVLRITQRGKECHSGCRIRELTGDCIMPREGVFAEVIKGGILRPGEEIFMENPEKTGCYRAAVVTLSDKASRGEREDKSGPLLAKLLKDQGFEVIEELILSDEAGELKKNLIRLADRRDADLIVTTGGTGFAPRDITPEATMAVATKNVPGIAEAIRAGSMKYTPKAMLSRAVSVIRNRTLIINFPGSPKAVEESFELIKEVLPHGLGILTGREGECARNGEKS